jgi:hypothetical protein
MPAPGPKDGHASKASRDLQLTRGTSAKSNGFKYGAITKESSVSNKRCGISQGRRDRESLLKLRERYHAQKKKRKRDDDVLDVLDVLDVDLEEEESDDDDGGDDENEIENEKKKRKKRRVEKTESEKEEEKLELEEEEDVVDSAAMIMKSEIITYPWTCECCEKTMQAKAQRDDHMNSKKHRKLVQRARGRDIVAKVLDNKRHG